MKTEFQTTFGLDDKVSAPLNKIIKLCNELNSYLDEAQLNFDSLENTELKDLNTNINKVSSSLNDVKKGAGQVETSFKDVGSTSFSALNKDLDRLNSTLNSVEKSAQGAETDIDSINSLSFSGLKNEANKISTKIKNIGKSAQPVKSDLKEISEIDLDNGSADSLNDTLSHLSDAVDLQNFMNLSEIVSNISDKMGDFVASAMDAAEVMGNFSNQFEIGLNLPQADLQGLQDETMQAYLNNYGESLDELAEKAIYAKQLLGDKLEVGDMSELLAQMTTLEGNGMDFNETLRGINSMSSTWGTTWQHNADMLTVAMQSGLNFSDELGDNMAEYAQLFKGTGFSDADILALGKIGQDTGAYNLDKIMDFMKEFQIALKDGRMEKNITRFGDATEDAFWRMQDRTASAKDVFNAMISDLNNMPDLKRGTLLSDTFSALGEDNADAVILAMKDYEQVAQDVFGNVSGSAQAAADANGTAAGQLKRWWEAMPMVLAPIGEGIASAIVNPIKEIQNIGSIISSLWSGEITFTDLTEQGKQSIDSYINGFVDGMPEMVNQGWQAITNFLTGIAQKIPDLALGALDMLIGLANGIAQNLPTLMVKAGETLQAFTQGLRDNLPTIISAGIEMIGNFISGLLQRLPDIITAGMNLVTGLVTGLVQMIPSLAASALNLMIAFAGGIWKYLPSIIEAGLNIVTSLVSGIAQAIPTLIVKAFELIVKFGQAIWEAAPQLLEVAKEIGANVISGFTNGLNSIWESVTSWFNEHFGWIIDSVKNILGIASPSTIFNDIGSNLIQGFLNGVQSIWESVSGWFNSTFKGLIDTAKGWISNLFGGGEDEPQMDFAQTEEELNTLRETVQTTFDQINAQTAQITSMCNAVVAQFTEMVTNTLAQLTNLETTAISVISSMCSALISTSSTFATTFESIWNTAKNTIEATVSTMARDVLSAIQKMDSNILAEINTLPPKFKSIGVSMMNSLKSGISSKTGEVSSTAGQLVQQLKTTFETGLGIHSPSDYMIWVGQMMLAGLLQGMSGDQVQKFIGNMISDMQTSFEAGHFNANELVNFLSDDAVLNVIGRVGQLDTSKMSDQTIAYPLAGGEYPITSLYGYRIHPIFGNGSGHAGIDIGAPEGTPILSALAGTVSIAQSGFGGYGNAVIVDSGDMRILYGHMSQIGAQVGQQVQKGQQIGLVGSTGWSTGAHLHFEFRHMDGSTFDPFDALMGASVSTGGNPLQTAIQNAYNAKHGIVTSSSGISASSVNYDPSAGVAQWTPQVLQALQMLGQPASLLNDVLYAIERESGGRPAAYNDWDSNASIGQNSSGLLQVIPDTFAAMRSPDLPNNVNDPLANLYAGLHWMIYAHGGIHETVEPRRNSPDGWYGYAVGTRYVPQDMLAMIHEGEAIIPAGQNPYSDSGGDYLGDIASRIVDNSIDYSPYLEPNDTGAQVINVGNINTTVNVSGETANNPQETARIVSEQILRDLKTELTRKAGVRRGY